MVTKFGKMGLQSMLGWWITKCGNSGLQSVLDVGLQSVENGLQSLAGLQSDLVQTYLFIYQRQFNRDRILITINRLFIFHQEKNRARITVIYRKSK